jgi:hypothetical protein
MVYPVGTMVLSVAVKIYVNQAKRNFMFTDAKWDLGLPALKEIQVNLILSLLDL